MVLFVIAFITSAVVGIFINAQILLPLIYGIPRSLDLFSRGHLRFRGVVSQLMTPVIWTVGLAIFSYVLSIFAPSVLGFLISNPGVLGGQVFSVVALILYSLTSRGRSDMSDDFFQTTIKQYSLAQEATGDSRDCEIHRSPMEEYSVPYTYTFRPITERHKIPGFLEALNTRFPNVEKIITGSRFTQNGNNFFRFNTCSRCLEAFYQFVVGTGTNGSISLTEASKYFEGDVDNSKYEEWLDIATKTTPSGCLWGVEANLIRIASVNNDYDLFSEVLKIIASRPSIDMFAEPKSSSVPIGSSGDRIERETTIVAESQSAHPIHRINFDVVADDLAFLKDHGEDALRERVLERLSHRVKIDE